MIKGRKAQTIAVIGIILALVVIGLLIYIALKPTTTGEVIKEKETMIKGGATCNSPYIKVGNSCCLDQNSNNICDNEEVPINNANNNQQESQQTSQPTPYCGDGSCNNGETCSSCSTDCGACIYINKYNEFLDFLFSCIENCPKTAIMGIISIECVETCNKMVETEKEIQLNDETIKKADNNHQIKFNCLQACATYGGYKYDCTHTCLS